MDEERKSRQDSWEYYAVGERAQLTTRVNTICTRGCMDVQNNGTVQQRKVVPTDVKKEEGKMREGSQSRRRG